MNGIITVFDEELEELKAHSLIEDIKRIGGRKFYYGRMIEQEIVFVKTANNPIDIVMTTQLMIDNFSLSRIFFIRFGIFYCAISQPWRPCCGQLLSKGNAFLRNPSGNAPCR
jgi:hypothetical protein